jgi:resuscitation-promoting factor RpfB
MLNTLLMVSLLLGSQTKVDKSFSRGYREKYIVTAYSQGEKNVGFITKTGNRVKRGTIAVDPRYIPYGSKIYVPGYGWGIADDCGGAIKRRHIDVYLTSRHSASRWGRKILNIIVYLKRKHK